MRRSATFRVFLLPLIGALASCGGGNGVSASGAAAAGGSGGGGTTAWKPGVFLPSTSFAKMCAAPRAGTSDRQGTSTDENNWLRSWTNELYLWYSEVTDVDPS